MSSDELQIAPSKTDEERLLVVSPELADVLSTIVSRVRGTQPELGDCRRFSASRKAVRHTGLDVTVYSSDDKRAPGRLSRQGSPLLRWALYEAAKCAARPASPDHAYYSNVKDRLGGNRAALSMARKIARRSHHILRSLGDQALATA